MVEQNMTHEDPRIAAMDAADPLRSAEWQAIKQRQQEFDDRVAERRASILRGARLTDHRFKL